MKKNIIASFSWSYAEKISTQLISFVLSIILARLLTPEDYGQLALVNIFIVIISAATLTGFGTALIQKKEVTDIDFSTSLLFSLGLSLCVYLILFLCAPLISNIFAQDITPFLRIASLSLVIASANTVFHAFIIRRMLFNKLFIASIIAVVFSAIVGIYMAYNGFGVWALVAQYLTSATINCIVSGVICGWHPKFEFSKKSLQETYNFAWKLIVSAVIDALYRQLRSLAIGKKYSADDLAFYERGNQYPSLLINNIDTSIASVLAPVLAKDQDNITILKAKVRRSLQTSSVLLFPLLIGLAVCAKPIVLLMLTEKWISCVPYLQILSVALMFKPIQTANLQGIIAIGLSNVYLKIQIIQKIIGVVIIAVSVLCFKSVVVIAIGELVAYFLFSIVNIYPNVKYLNYGIKQQITDIMPQLFISCLMGIVVYAINISSISIPVLLLIQVLVGATIYIIISRMLKIKAFMYVWNTCLSYTKSKIKK